MWMLQYIRFQNLEGFPSGVISTNEPTNYSDLMFHLLAITLCYTLPYDLFSIHYPPTHLHYFITGVSWSGWKLKRPVLFVSVTAGVQTEQEIQKELLCCWIYDWVKQKMLILPIGRGSRQGIRDFLGVTPMWKNASYKVEPAFFVL